jgi:alkylhydroperoxidase family enzyme
MRIPDWTPEAHPQPPALLQAVLERRGGHLLNLDKALLWSGPVASGWHAYFQHVRANLTAPRKWCELGICTVALLTGADYEYHHHAPDFLKAGGSPAELKALEVAVANDPAHGVSQADLGPLEQTVVQYAAQMTQNIQVDDAVFKALQSQMSTTALVELTTAIATYNMVARILIALQIRPEA